MSKQKTALTTAAIALAAASVPNEGKTSEVIANAGAAQPAPAVVTTPVADKKSTKANAIFKEMFAQSPVPARKDMIARAKAEAGLTDAGAATYLQNFKKANGLVAAKA